MSTFDPNAAAQPGSGVFGLPHSRKEAGIVLVPVPFDATTSYGGGASGGPAAILAASAQVDLYDRQFGRIYEAGIHMLPEPRDLIELSAWARGLAEAIIARGGAEGSADAADAKALRQIEGAGERVDAYAYESFRSILNEGKVPGLVGGDHATPLGAIRACAEHVASGAASPGGAKAALGVLHIDAHMDLRPAYEGFRFSHASIMHNVLSEVPGVGRLSQVGIRDFSEGELEALKAQGARACAMFDLDTAREMLDGARWSDLCRRAIDPLPQHVYISFDIDGLDPSMCPHTGTPVPGGLSFSQASILLQTLRDSGRSVVGFDLVEVTPGPDVDAPDWDANVGARVLYKLCGAAAPRAR